MKRTHLLSLLVIGFGWTSAVQPADPAALNIERIREVALNPSSLLLDAPDKVRVAGTFVSLLQIKGISGQEELIREEVKHIKSMISSIMSICYASRFWLGTIRFRKTSHRSPCCQRWD